MNKLHPTHQQFGTFQALATYLNDKLFGGALPEVMLNLSRRPKSLGFFVPNRWSRHDANGACVERTHEISINPNHLAFEDPREVAQTLAHELCHLWQEVCGKPSRRGYHNRQWSKKMKEIGLQPICPKTLEPKMSAQKLTDVIIPGGAFERAYADMPRELRLPWSYDDAVVQPVLVIAGEPARVSSSRNKVKFSCPTCAANAWGKPSLEIKCARCDQLFRRAG